MSEIPIGEPTTAPQLSKDQRFQKVVTLADQLSVDSPQSSPITFRKNSPDTTAVGALSRIVLNQGVLVDGLASGEYTREVIDLLFKMYSVRTSWNSRTMQDEGISQATVEKIHHFASGFIDKNFDSLSRVAETDPDPEILGDVLSLVNKTGPTGNFERRFDFFIDHIDQALRLDLEMMRRESGLDPRSSEVKKIREREIDPIVTASWVIRLGSDQQRAKLTDNLADLLKDTYLSPLALVVLEFISTGLGPEAVFVRSQIMEKVIEPTLRELGLPVDKLRLAWQVAGDSGIALIQNLESIKKLESARPGIVSALIAEFNIMNFQRYTDEVLINLFDNRGDAESPYGIMVFAKKDQEGAPAFGSSSASVKALSEKLTKLGFRLRIFECGNKGELGRIVVNAKRRYRPKAAFAIVAAHGMPGHISFGDVKNADASDLDAANARAQLNTLDLAGNVSQGWGQFLEDGADLVLVSCLTGKGEDSIAGAISKTIPHARVVAPDESTKFPSINPILSEQGKLTFDVEYSRGVRNMQFQAEKAK